MSDAAETVASVVMPTFNRVSSLQEVVSAALDDPATGEIIMIIDGSRDGSVEFLQAWSEREPRIKPIYQENAGEEAARMRGIVAASNDVIVLLDDDVVAGPGLIGGHLKWHQDRHDLIVLGFMPTRTPSPREPGQVATFLYAQNYDDTCQLYERDPTQILTHLWAGNLSLRKSSIIGTNILSDHALLYHGDLRLGLQCAAAGWDAVFDRSLSASHSHSRPLSRFAEESRRSGAGRAALATEFPQFQDAIDPLSSLSWLQRHVIEVLASPNVRPLSSRAAEALAVISSGFRLWNIETYAARVLRQIELVHAFQTNSAA